MNFEDYKNKLIDLIEWKNTNIMDRNEATTRLHLIDRIFFECLNWNKEDCVAEEPHGQEYTDYTFNAPYKALIVEAKKEGIYFELPVGFKNRKYKIKTLTNASISISDAISQTISYCQKRGVSVGLVCNGFQIIAFIGSRNDGIPPEDGSAIVYDSLEEINNDFLYFWQIFSKNGIIGKRIEKDLCGIEIPVLPTKLSSRITEYPGIKGRNLIQADLQILSDLLLEELIKSEEIEEDFLRYAYCSSGALSQYAIISKNILQNRYLLLFDKHVEGPTIEPANTKRGINVDFSNKSIYTRPILLIGDVGVGKSIFIKNFMKVEAKEIMSNSIPLYIDLGSKAALANDLKQFFVSEIIKILLDKYGIDIEEDHFVRGVYNLEIQRFQKGIYSKIKEQNSIEYLSKEIEFLEEKLKNKEEHLKLCLNHISKGRKTQIIIFMDNVDQRDEPIQESAFLISQDVAANWPALVFLTIRPQTYYKSKIEGALSGYHPKAFTIAPPRVDDVINKRIEFALKIARGNMKISCLSENILLKLNSLETYLEILKFSFNNNNELFEFIDNICYGNIRLALELITTFIGSGHVDTEKIFKRDEINRNQKPPARYIIPVHEFLRAIIFGNHIYYYPEATTITNLFDISQNDGKEHFLNCILIDYLNRSSSKSKFGGFVELKDLYDYGQNLGFNVEQLNKSIIKLLNTKLLESEARKLPKSLSDIPNSLRITTIGAYHVQKLITKFVYIDAVLIDVPILDKIFRDNITDCHLISDRIKRAEIFKQYLDLQWDLMNIEQCGFNWINKSKELTENINFVKMKNEKGKINNTKK
jgi:hypothetical protein